MRPFRGTNFLRRISQGYWFFARKSRDYRNSQHRSVQLQAFLARCPMRRVAFKPLNSALTRRENLGLQADEFAGGLEITLLLVLSVGISLYRLVVTVCRLGRLEHGSQAGLRTVPCDCLVSLPQTRENNETLGRKMGPVSEWFSVLELSEKSLSIW